VRWNSAVVELTKVLFETCKLISVIVLSVFQENGYGTDVELCCRNGSVVVHGALLAQVSPRVASLLSSRKCLSEPAAISLADMDVEAVKILVRVLYTGQATFEVVGWYSRVVEAMGMLGISIPINKLCLTEVRDVLTGRLIDVHSFDLQRVRKIDVMFHKCVFQPRIAKVRVMITLCSSWKVASSDSGEMAASDSTNPRKSRADMTSGNSAANASHKRRSRSAIERTPEKARGILKPLNGSVG
jgi:hypothetical protein